MSVADIQLRARYKIQSAALEAMLNTVTGIVNVIGDVNLIAGQKEYATRADMLAESDDLVKFAITLNFEPDDGVISTWVRSSDSGFASMLAAGSDVWESTATPGTYWLRLTSRAPV